jgi:hypothetical protein
MPGPRAKDAKTLPEATYKASELHGEAIKPGAGALALKPLAWQRTCTYRCWKRSRPQRMAADLIAIIQIRVKNIRVCKI